MATLTYDPTPADQPEFNEAEQEALAVGEQAAADQQQMELTKQAGSLASAPMMDPTKNPNLNGQPPTEGAPDEALPPQAGPAG